MLPLPFHVPPVAEKNLTKRGRRVLKQPERPIALRNEYMSNRKMTLVLHPSGNYKSSYAYTINDEDACMLFTVTGRYFGARSCREIRDKSGLPLFEIRQRSPFAYNAWVVSLPGCDDSQLAVCHRGSLGNQSLTFENLAALDGKRSEERNITIDIEKHGRVLTLFDVVDGDRRIMDVRESIRHNDKLALTPSSKSRYRPAMDLTIMPGVDMSLKGMHLDSGDFALSAAHRATDSGAIQTGKVHPYRESASHPCAPAPAANNAVGDAT
ncbi:hypothetical protein N7451_012256 [Penicillium sp. IBT 35674x]|nr:hypothetical protein N7451_012256 [Penicillium sp. IBT 35674x]